MLAGQLNNCTLNVARIVSSCSVKGYTQSKNCYVFITLFFLKKKRKAAYWNSTTSAASLASSVHTEYTSSLNMMLLSGYCWCMTKCGIRQHLSRVTLRYARSSVIFTSPTDTKDTESRAQPWTAWLTFWQEGRWPTTADSLLANCLHQNLPQLYKPTAREEKRAYTKSKQQIFFVHKPIPKFFGFANTNVCVAVDIKLVQGHELPSCKRSNS